MKKEQIKNIANDFRMLYKSWDKITKTIFYLGLITLISNVIIIIINFNNSIISSKAEYQNQFKALVDHSKVVLPNSLRIIWGNTITFTEISNFMLSITLIIFAFKKEHQKVQAWFFATITYITITFVVYWSLVLPSSLDTWKALHLALPSFFVHAIHPILGFIALFLVRKTIFVKNTQIWMSNLFVLVYFAFALVVFLIGSQLLDLKNFNGNEEKYQAYRDFNVVIYPFLNFRFPLFYKGDNPGIIFILDLILVILAVFLTPALGFMWKGIMRVKQPEGIQKAKKDKLEKAV
ncbi:MAGa3780 family membrane protein [Mycoplasma struthionis]|uniref:DUF1600 domain-containing protein n=1 Tax=Mycoplasma struthionis TaxID=538220 RepID=A0A3G8LFN5_9MOLU|nr:hypothetical protein [Mycoplasma struthionis]AZG68426.1 hypothetical protein EGN60_00320 [Mycoplasma struthionis]TPI02957.1 hypothetical protein FJM01_00190 [Mycoplasma struthionis]